MFSFAFLSGYNSERKFSVCVAVFAQRYFSEIVRSASHPFQEAVLPTILGSPAKFQQMPKELIVRTFGKKHVDLFLPPLFKPLQPSDPRARISRSETGGYVLELAEELNEIQIPLTEDENIAMMPHLREINVDPPADRVPAAARA